MPEGCNVSCSIPLAKNFGISEMQHVSVTHSLYLQFTYILTAPINHINSSLYKPTKMRAIHIKNTSNSSKGSTSSTLAFSSAGSVS